MKMVQTVLRGVRDDHSLLDQGDYSLPLLGLADALNAASPGSSFNHETSGAALKTALEGVESTLQMRLLNQYRRQVQDLVPTGAADVPTPAATPGVWNGVERRASLDLEKEKLRMRHWLMKWGFVAIAPLPCIVVGAMLVIAVREGAMPDNQVVNGIMNTATEILKVIFNLSS